MTESSSPDPHPFRLAHLAADADDVVAMLTRHHEDVLRMLGIEPGHEASST